MAFSSSCEHVAGLRLCIGYLGYALMFAGGIVMSPLLALPLYPQEAHLAPLFIFTGIGSMLIGYLSYFMSIRDLERGRLSKAEGAAVITASWIAAIVVFCVPCVASGLYTVPQAVFETTSGLSTTGLSITDVASCPRLFLLYRSAMHFFGGVGLLLVLASLVSDNGLLSVYSAEGHTDRLLPSVTQTARVVLLLYCSYIVLGIVAYAVLGMPIFDAVNISISAVSTGGFAVHPDSIAAYGSPAIELVSVALMLLGATNFLAAYLLIRGDFAAFVHHAETKMLCLTVVSFTALVSVMFISRGEFGSAPQAVLASLFHVVSVLTTTGFQTIDSFAVLPSTVLMLFMILMFFGGEAGSTSGGIKLYRIVVLGKTLFWELRDRFGHRRNVYSHKISRFGKRIECEEQERRDVFSFVALYIALFVVGSFVFTLAGYSLGDSVFEFASCLGNVGVSIGLISADATPLVLWTASAGMLLGRLEIIPVFLGIWKLWTLSGRALRDRKGRVG